MLPKVGAALKEFVAPVSATSQRRVEQHDRQKEQRQKQSHGQSPGQSNDKSKDQPKEQLAKVIPFPTQAGLTPKAQTALAPQSPAPLATPAKQPEQSVTQTVMQLLTLFSQQRLVLLRWFGKKTYEASARGNKKGATLRKGTILDDKAQ